MKARGVPVAGLSAQADAWRQDGQTVLAVAIALSMGIGASYWLGMACYVVAGGIYALAVRSSPLPDRYPSRTLPWR